MVLTGIEPKKVFEYFEWLSSVPHGSHNTKAISDLCVSFAKEHSLKYYQDDVNNVIIYKPASAGCENSDTVILQGHLDMVCAKTQDNPIDMSKEPITIETDGEWITAKNTSLGGDNIIAVASILAILDDDSLTHPALEAVFTTDEEIGLDGAKALDLSKISGRKLINIDSEEEGVIIAGCAGGARVNGYLPIQRCEPDFEGFYVHFEVGGLLGGHSGADIDKERANSNKLMGRFLRALENDHDFRIADLHGGQFDNVITMKTEALVYIKETDVDSVKALADQYDAIFKDEYKASDKDVYFTMKMSGYDLEPLDSESTHKVVGIITILPFGIQNMNYAMKGMVQTSVNLGITEMQEDQFRYSSSVRSSIKSQKEELITRLRTIAEVFGVRVEITGDYPPWEFKRNSTLRDTIISCYKQISGKDASVSITHGGLECGIFSDKMKDCDCVSIGPDLFDVHSVRERLNIASTQRTYKLLTETLKELC